MVAPSTGDLRAFGVDFGRMPRVKISRNFPTLTWEEQAFSEARNFWYDRRKIRFPFVYTEVAAARCS